MNTRVRIIIHYAYPERGTMDFTVPESHGTPEGLNERSEWRPEARYNYAYLVVILHEHIWPIKCTVQLQCDEECVEQ
jgi:hypothetical protein